MNDSEPFQRASAAASRFLSYRPRSEAEVRGRLSRRFPPHVVDRVIRSLTERALIDDVSFAGLWADSRDTLNPRSASAIRRELISKGVAADVADAAVLDIDDNDSAYRASLGAAQRLAQANADTFRRKLWGHLQRRGFSGSVARTTIVRLWGERQANLTQTSLDVKGG